MTENKPDPQEQDVLLVLGQHEDGTVQAVRNRKGAVELAALAPVEHGKPLTGEMIRLKEREGSPVLWDVETVYAPTADVERRGPAQVATDAYRDGWDRIFGGDAGAQSPPRDQLN